MSPPTPPPPTKYLTLFSTPGFELRCLFGSTANSVNRTGASRVVILNHVIRYGPVANHKFNFGPSQKVHVDLSMADAERTVKMLRPEGEAGETGNKRWAYLNVCCLPTLRKDCIACLGKEN